MSPATPTATDNSRQVLLDETRADDLPPLLHRARPLGNGDRLRHGWHVLRVRVQGRRRRARRTANSPAISREEQTHRQDDQRRARSPSGSSTCSLSSRLHSLGGLM